jgi:hypothetical protein
MRTYTPEEKAQGLTRCFCWFVGLLALNIGAFWVPLVMTSSRHANDDLLGWIIVVGLVINCVLSIVFIYKLARLLGTNYVWILWMLAANVPFIATIAWLLLCNRAFKELSRLGSRMTLLLSRLGGGLLSGSLLLTGGYAIMLQVQEIWHHEQLKKSGTPITGILQIVTKHSVNFIPAGYSFTVEYAGRSKDFTADSKLFRENTLPNGMFTHHNIALTYLPDHPEVAELEGTSPSFLTGFFSGGLIAFLGGAGLYAAIKNKIPRNNSRQKSANKGEPAAPRLPSVRSP